MEGKGFAQTAENQPMQVIELASDFLVSVHVLFTHSKDDERYKLEYESVR